MNGFGQFQAACNMGVFPHLRTWRGRLLPEDPTYTRSSMVPGSLILRFR